MHNVIYTIINFNLCNKDIFILFMYNPTQNVIFTFNLPKKKYLHYLRNVI